MTYSPLDPETLKNPFLKYQELRQETPVFWHKDLHAWVFTEYEDCKFVLSDYKKFARNPSKLLGLKVEGMEEMTIQSHDPPDSVPLRRAIFNAIQKIDLVNVCQSSLDQLDNKILSYTREKTFNYMSEISAPVAINFACRLIGLPLLSPKYYHDIFLRITRAMDSSLDPKRQRPGVIATNELNKLVLNSIPKSSPGSVIFELLQDPSVQKMPIKYVRNTISAMFNAAYSTAYTSMGSFLNFILTTPSCAKHIKNCGSLDATVQELLRLTSPAQATMRFATQDILFRSIHIKKSDPVIVLLASANHDSQTFQSPSKFDPGRFNNIHLGFGWGVHFCVGAIPAREFLKHYIIRIRQHFDMLQLAETTTWEETATLRCLKILLLKRCE